ncbi:MAG: ECF-type sigma factor [Acidobacteriota bacterium]
MRETGRLLSPDRDAKPCRHEVTRLLRSWSQGDQGALERLMPLVYDSLRGVAGRFLGGERPDHTLQAAALVHETYLRLLVLDRIDWRDRAHFYSLCARFMRRILVDHARRTRADKRGGEIVRVTLDDADDVVDEVRPSDLLALEAALEALAELDAEAARIVELRFFGGLNRDEIAEVTASSSATVTRRWRMARAWLRAELAGGATDGSCEEPAVV